MSHVLRFAKRPSSGRVVKCYPTTSPARVTSPMKTSQTLDEWMRDKWPKENRTEAIASEQDGRGPEVARARAGQNYEKQSYRKRETYLI